MEIFKLSTRNRQAAIDEIRTSGIEKVYANPMGRTILHIAAEDDDIDLLNAIVESLDIKHLIAIGSRSPFSTAIRCESVRVVERFLSFNIEVTIKDAMYAIRSKNRVIQRMVMDRLSTQDTNARETTKNHRTWCRMCEIIRYATHHLNPCVLDRAYQIHPVDTIRRGGVCGMSQNQLYQSLHVIIAAPVVHPDVTYNISDMEECIRITITNGADPTLDNCNFFSKMISSSASMVSSLAVSFMRECMNDHGKRQRLVTASRSMIRQAYKLCHIDAFAFLLGVCEGKGGLIYDLLHFHSMVGDNATPERLDMLDMMLTARGLGPHHSEYGWRTPIEYIEHGSIHTLTPATNYAFPQSPREVLLGHLRTYHRRLTLFDLVTITSNKN